LPLADVEESNNPANRQLIEDYAYWFTKLEYADRQGYEFFPGIPFIPPLFIPKRRISFTVALVVVLVSGAGIGIVLGSLLASMELARILAVAGAVLFGILGLKAGSKLGIILGTYLGRHGWRDGGSLARGDVRGDSWIICGWCCWSDLERLGIGREETGFCRILWGNAGGHRSSLLGGPGARVGRGNLRWGHWCVCGFADDIWAENSCGS
jgi:hypothetical protein